MRSAISLILLIFAMFLPQSASFAANWKPVSPGFIDNYYDVDSIVRTKSGIVKFWLRSENMERQLNGKKIITMINRQELRCAQREVRITHILFYFEDNTNWSSEFDETEFESIAPGTLAEQLYKKLCRPVK